MPRPAKSRPAKSRMARILVIDDDDAVREATAMVLESERFEVVAVADGRSGIEAVKAGSFDLAIIDLFMPGLNGLETTKAIRQLNPSLPVIAVSGFMLGNRQDGHLEMPNFGPMATEVGAVATLYKPFQPAALLQAIDEAVHRRGRHSPPSDSLGGQHHKQVNKNGDPADAEGRRARAPDV